MVSNERTRKLRFEPVARWLATVAAAIFCALSLVVTPFGCAVGEFEEDRNCSPSVWSWVSVGLLALTVVVALVARDRRMHWIGLAITVVLAYAGATQA